MSETKADRVPLRQRLAPVLEYGRRLLPVVSFATGVASALLMERHYGRLPLLLGVLFGAWLTVGLLLAWRGRSEPSPRGRLAAVRYGALVVAQSTVQQVLFFVLPFYFQSATFWSPNVAFVALLALAALVTLIDPAFFYLAERPLLFIALIAIDNLAALNFALPVVLGLRNNLSLHLSLLLTVMLVVPLAAITVRGQWRPRIRLWVAAAIGGSALLAVAIWLLDLQLLIPPAPLRLVDGRIAEGVVEREPLRPATWFAPSGDGPDRLYCFTAIAAPRGLDEQIVHLWSYGGQVKSRVELSRISGGREQGFRTWSAHGGFLRAPAGRWRCEVRTAGNQIIGRVEFEIGAPASGESRAGIE
ncbi:MAG: DUF2914 domain-containing protein [Deltaproteobacteria bacterium]|nr:DUF2914 domain-containing protein [Deltaproteobacteria bacterium]